MQISLLLPPFVFSFVNHSISSYRHHNRKPTVGGTRRETFVLNSNDDVDESDTGVVVGVGMYIQQMQNTVAERSRTKLRLSNEIWGNLSTSSSKKAFRLHIGTCNPLLAPKIIENIELRVWLLSILNFLVPTSVLVMWLLSNWLWYLIKSASNFIARLAGSRSLFREAVTI